MVGNDAECASSDDERSTSSDASCRVAWYAGGGTVGARIGAATLDGIEILRLWAFGVGVWSVVGGGGYVDCNAFGSALLD